MKKRVLRERRRNATDTNVATIEKAEEVKPVEVKKKRASKKKEA